MIDENYVDRKPDRYLKERVSDRVSKGYITFSGFDVDKVLFVSWFGDDGVFERIKFAGQHVFQINSGNCSNGIFYYDGYQREVRNAENGDLEGFLPFSRQELIGYAPNLWINEEDMVRVMSKAFENDKK